VQTKHNKFAAADIYRLWIIFKTKMDKSFMEHPIMAIALMKMKCI